MYFTFGPGIVILALALAAIIVGVILLVKLLRTDWNMSVSSFNARFAHESSLGQQDMEIDSKRRAVARNLGITPESMQQRNISVAAGSQPSQARSVPAAGASTAMQETELLSEQPTWTQASAQPQKTEVLTVQQVAGERTEEL